MDNLLGWTLKLTSKAFRDLHAIMRCLHASSMIILLASLSQMTGVNPSSGYLSCNSKQEQIHTC